MLSEGKHNNNIIPGINSSIIAVPQIWGHTRIAAPPPPLRNVRASHFYREKGSTLFSLVDSRLTNCAYTSTHAIIYSSIIIISLAIRQCAA